MSAYNRIADVASRSRAEQCERGPGVGDGCAAAQPVGRPLKAEPCARRAGVAAQVDQRTACLLGKRPVAAGEGERPQLRALQKLEARPSTRTTAVTGPGRSRLSSLWTGVLPASAKP